MSIFPPTSSPRSTMSGQEILLVTLHPNVSDSNSTWFLSLSCHSGSSNIVMNFSLINSFPIESYRSKNAPHLYQLVLSSPNWWGPTWFNLGPFCFIKPDQHPLHIVAFPSSSVTPQHWRLNGFNFTWYYVFEIRSLINWILLETLIGWRNFDIATIILKNSYSIFSNRSEKLLTCPYGAWCLPATILCVISVFVILLSFGKFFKYSIIIILKTSNWKLLTIKFCFLLIHNSCYSIPGISNTYFGSYFILFCFSFWSSSFLSWHNIWIRYVISSGSRGSYGIISGNRCSDGILSWNRCSDGIIDENRGSYRGSYKCRCTFFVKQIYSVFNSYLI